MANEIEVKIPDIGGAAQVDVIEVLVQVGDAIELETPLITLESDKASMEIPSSTAGIVRKLCVKVGDKVSEGDLILIVESEEQHAPEPQKEIRTDNKEPKEESITQSTSQPRIEEKEILIPDIGGAIDVDVIDILVKEGTHVEKDQSLITLEGDKATMDIPAPCSGLVKKIMINLGDKVSQGSSILILEAENTSFSPTPNPIKTQQTQTTTSSSPSISTTASITKEPEQIAYSGVVAAGPAVRRMARELGVSLDQVKGTGRKGRISKEDIQSYVKLRLSQPASGFLNTSPAPIIDFSKFGTIETKPLNKIKKLTGINVHRSWVTIPHVTQFDEADITDLEAFRKSESEQQKDSGYKLTILAFVCSVVAKALQEYPQFNASLDPKAENLIYKKYYNIGIAVDTPNGLVVPVIKDVATLTVAEIAQEMARLSAKARDKGLLPTDMSGGCFTISSLGGIGGTAFTPIVNSPEVAILGLSRSSIKPAFINGEFVPRLMLPLSLSYDHRVIDGAEAARFSRFICNYLSDIRKVIL